MRSLFSVRNFVILVVIILALICIVPTVIGANRGTSISELKTIKVGKKNLEKLVIASGKVQSSEVLVQKPNDTGKLKDVIVDVNDYVQVNQVLAVIETTDKFGKKQDKDLKAVIAGNISAILAKEGQPVLQDETPLLEISNLAKVKVIAEIVEADINKTQPGQIVKINIPALDDVQVNGKVTMIDIAPIVTQVSSTPSYNVEINLDSAPAGVRLGMTTNVEIITATKPDALAVNDSYVFKKDGKSYVKVVTTKADNTELIDTEVSLGFRAETEVEILTGLAVGQELALPTAEIRNSRDSFSLFGGN